MTDNLIASISSGAFQSSSKQGAFLDKNENPFSLPPSPLEEIRNALANMNFNRYPDPQYLALRKALSVYCGFSAEEIIVGNGGDEILWMIFAAFIRPGDTVLSFDPSFSEYGHLCSVFRAEHKSVPIKATKDGFFFDKEAFIDAISSASPKLILLDSPNNPTGRQLSNNFLNKVISLSNCLVVVDEAYGEFAGDTLLSKITPGSIPENTLILKTLSKAWGLAGIRLGYAVSDQKTLKKLNSVRSPFNVNVATEEIAKITLKYRKWMEKRVFSIKVTRDNFIRSLNNALPGWKAYESDANFVLVHCPISKTKICQILKSENIFVKFLSWNSLKDTWLRVSIGRESEMQHLLDALRKLEQVYQRESERKNTA